MSAQSAHEALLRLDANQAALRINRPAPIKKVSLIKWTKPEIPARPDWADSYYPPVAHRTRPRAGDAFFTLADLGMSGIDYVKAGR